MPGRLASIPFWGELGRWESWKLYRALMYEVSEGIKHTIRAIDGDTYLYHARTLATCGHWQGMKISLSGLVLARTTYLN